MSIVKSLFSKITRERIAVQSTGYSAYRQLLEQLVAGVEPPPDEARIVVEQIGKSPEEIEKDVEILRQRKRDQLAVANRSKLDADLQQAESELTAIRLEWEAANRAFQQRFDSAKSRSGQAQAHIGGAIFAESRLESSCLNPALVQEERELRANLSRLASEIRRKRENQNTVHNMPDAVVLLQSQIDQLQAEYDACIQDIERNKRQRIAD